MEEWKNKQILKIQDKNRRELSADEFVSEGHFKAITKRKIFEYKSQKKRLSRELRQAAFFDESSA